MGVIRLGVLKDNFEVLGLKDQVLGLEGQVLALSLVNRCICLAFRQGGRLLPNCSSVSIRPL